MKIHYILFVLLFCLRCATPDLLPTNENRLVVEGWISQNSDTHTVKLSRIVSFNDKTPETYITNATVSVVDNFGKSYPFSHVGNGRYVSQNMKGIENRLYKLTITLENGDKVYSDFEKLNPVIPITRVIFSTFDELQNGQLQKVYYPIVYIPDPIDQKNYYRITAHNGKKYLNAPEQIILLNDKFINGQTHPLYISNFKYSLGDTAYISLQSISKSAYQFLTQLKLQTSTLGTTNDTAPSVINGNLYYEDKKEKILGFFGAISLVQDTLMIK